MPPSQSQKGTGKKGNSVRQSRSRNTTPSLNSASLPPAESGDTAYLELPIASFRTSATDEIIEQHGSSIPSSKDLEALMERLQRLMDIVETRGNVCDRGMRMLAQARKDRLEEIESERRDAERMEMLKRDATAEEEERGRKANKPKKKSKDVSRAREERPLANGASQDMSNLGIVSLV